MLIIYSLDWYVVLWSVKVIIVFVLKTDQAKLLLIKG